MKNMQFKKIVVTYLLWFGATTSAFASPQADGLVAVKTNDGYVVVWNQPDMHFTLGLKGKNVRPMGTTGTGSMAFGVDGVVLQVQSVAVSEFLKDGKKQKLSNQAILAAHQKWESQYLKQSFGAELNVITLPQPSSPAGEVMMWKFPLPRNKAQQQIFLTTVSGNHVVILNGTLEGKAPVPEATIQRLLLDTISTLKASASPIDLMKVRESVLQSRPPAANRTESKLQHNWRIEQGRDAVIYFSNYSAPVPFSESGEPEANIVLESVQLSGKAPVLSELVKSEVAEIRKGTQIAEYLEADGHQPQNNIASWVEEIDGQPVAFIKYRAAGIKGQGSIPPRTFRHAFFIRNGKLHFIHLMVIFAKHQEEVRGDQIRLIKGLIGK